MTVSMGIDLSLNSTGVVTLGPELYAETKIKPDARGVVRLTEIEADLKKEIICYEPDIICLEDYSYASANQSHQIGELGGVIRVLLHLLMVNWRVVSPAQVKKFATGKGNASKVQVIKAVDKRWGIDTDSDDIADAFVLAKIGQALLGKECQNQEQREVVEAIKKKGVVV